MKSIIEHMITMVVLSVMVFVFSGILSIEQQIINARNYHTQVIEKIQDIGSYEGDTFDTVSNKLIDDSKNNLRIEVSNNKLFAKVEYDFRIIVPLLGVIEDNTIEGYAR